MSKTLRQQAKLPAKSSELRQDPKGDKKLCLPQRRLKPGPTQRQGGDQDPHSLRAWNLLLRP